MAVSNFDEQQFFGDARGAISRHDFWEAQGLFDAIPEDRDYLRRAFMDKAGREFPKLKAFLEDLNCDALDVQWIGEDTYGSLEGFKVADAEKWQLVLEGKLVETHESLNLFPVKLEWLLTTIEKIYDAERYEGIDWSAKRERHLFRDAINLTRRHLWTAHQEALGLLPPDFEEPLNVKIDNARRALTGEDQISVLDPFVRNTQSRQVSIQLRTIYRSNLIDGGQRLTGQSQVTFDARLCEIVRVCSLISSGFRYALLESEDQQPQWNRGGEKVLSGFFEKYPRACWIDTRAAIEDTRAELAASWSAFAARTAMLRRGHRPLDDSL